jgi:hypothetical protein
MISLIQDKFGISLRHWSKPPFGGSDQVLRYLGAYTHRVAISNHRLVSFDGEKISFRFRDSAHNNKNRLMTLCADEFLRLLPPSLSGSPLPRQSRQQHGSARPVAAQWSSWRG